MQGWTFPSPTRFRTLLKNDNGLFHDAPWPLSHPIDRASEVVKADGLFSQWLLSKLLFIERLHR